MQMKLKDGSVVFLDDEDYEKVSPYKWFLTAKGKYVGANYYKENGKRSVMYLHRFLLNAPKGLVVDHINGNILDNRKENLRLCSNQQNLWNMRSRGGTSNYKGVHWDKFKDVWKADISYNGKTIHLGSFDSEKTAAIAYNNKAKELYGEFARINKEVI